MGIKHNFVSPRQDSSDSTEVNASNWNDDHSITSDVDFGTHKAINIVDPTNPQDAATKNYVDTHGGSGGGFTPATGTFSSFKVTATASGNAIVSVTNPGADSAINLLDLGSAPSTGQIVIISVLPTSTGGYDVLSGGTPSGTAKAFALSSSVAPPGSAIWCFFNGTAWSPLFATPGQNLQVTNSVISANSVIAAGDIEATQLLMGGALRVQACILATNVGANATIDLDATSEGVVQRLYLNGQTGAGGSISNIINSAAAPTGGQTIEIINTSSYPVTLNGLAGGTGQLYLPAGVSSLVLQPGCTASCDYDGANELGHGSNTVIVHGVTPAIFVFCESGGFFGKAGVILISTTSGNINTAGSISASASVGAASFQVNGLTNIYSGTGSPNGSQVGSPGDVYLNKAGGSATTLYVKESGTATSTGWVGK